MISLAFNILKKEGVLINVFLFFLLFSPVYFLDIFLVIPLAMFLLHKELLNLSAPSEQIVTLYKLFGLPVDIILWTNILMIMTVNFFNVVLLGFSSFFVEETIQFYDCLKQVLVLNGVLFFAIAFGNIVLYYRLIRSGYYTVHKMIIVTMFVFSVFIIFTILFFLFRDPSILTGVMFILFVLIWVISIFKI